MSICVECSEEDRIRARAKRNKQYYERKKVGLVGTGQKRICKICNTEFEVPSDKPNQRTCGPVCAKLNCKNNAQRRKKQKSFTDATIQRNKRYRDRKKAGLVCTEQKRICKICDTEFEVPRDKPNQRTCGPVCAEINRKNTARECKIRNKMKRNAEYLVTIASKKKSEEIKKGLVLRKRHLKKAKEISYLAPDVGYPQSNPNYCPFG